MRITTPGKLLIDEALPEDMRGKDKELHSKGLKELFQDIAIRYPERYRDIAHNLMRVSSDAMYSSGGYSFGLKDLLPSKAFTQFKGRFNQDIENIVSNPKLSEADKAKKIVETTEQIQPDITKRVYDEAFAEGNPIAMQIHSGSKGKPFNLMSLKGGDLLYEDHRGKKVPIPVTRSYSEGLLPGEYWAGTYGARKGIVDLKTATQDAGYFGKQLTQAAHRLIVTAIDDGKDYHHDHPIGLPTKTDDLDNEGALLAHQFGPYGRNTVLTPKILAHLKELGHQDILVRSPTIGGPPDGGIYARDVGVRERGTLSPIGDFVGIGAAQSLAEPISQAQIGCLARGTLVRMGDGSEKRIEDIQVGDSVLGADTKGRTFETSVSRHFDKGEQPCITTTFKDTTQELLLLSTRDHKVLASTTLLETPTQLPVGTVADAYLALLATGDCISRYTQAPAGTIQTYDIEVDNSDHLFVLANGLIVSNSKHTGGVAGAGAGVSGFKAINQLVQVPKIFPGGATHSQLDGRVQRIVPVPGGGNRIFINDVPHYVGVGFDIKVKPGDHVEAGDSISNGLPNPADIVQHKHIGEGRKAFVDAFRQAAKDAGFNLHRRNVELVARGLINHVTLHEPMGDYLPDDVIPYSILEHNYLPRPGHKISAPGDAVNSYLERPSLHYTIGTKIRPSVADQMKKFGVKRVTSHTEPPPFEAEMIRGMANLSYDPDWMTRMLGSNLEKGLLQSTYRGGVSDERGTSYVPSLAKGVEFGKYPPIKGYNPSDVIKGRASGDIFGSNDWDE